MDLLSGDLDLEDEKDDMELLNEILNAPSGEDEFTQEWQNVFGNGAPSTASAALVEGEGGFDYMPSNLLESLNLNATGIQCTEVSQLSCFVNNKVTPSFQVESPKRPLVGHRKQPRPKQTRR